MQYVKAFYWWKYHKSLCSIKEMGKKTTANYMPYQISDVQHIGNRFV